MSGNYLRERLANLSLCKAAPLLSPTYGASEKVFTEEELSREPLKWLKYLLLDRTGLERIDNIATQINRFSLLDIDTAKAWVLNRFSFAENVYGNQMIVAKVVPWDSGAQLKNYRMFRREDADVAFEKIASDFPKVAHELWCCESPVGSKGLNAGGRLTYPESGNPQSLELVWFASPRFLESVKLPEFQFPYLRAERTFINPTFDIRVLHVPSSYSIDRQHFLGDFEWVARELEAKKLAMKVLVNSIRELGAAEVCFTFKLMDERLTITDWDSEIESVGIS